MGVRLPASRTATSTGLLAVKLGAPARQVGELIRLYDRARYSGVTPDRAEDERASQLARDITHGFGDGWKGRMSRRVAVTVAALGVAAVLAVLGWLLPALVLGAAAGAGWLLVMAWGAQPTPAALPPRRDRGPDQPERPPPSNRAANILRAARQLPSHLLADPAGVDSMSGRDVPRGGKDFERFVDELDRAVGR